VATYPRLLYVLYIFRPIKRDIRFQAAAMRPGAR
jgi:hypothetical protein